MRIVRHSFKNGLIGSELQWQAQDEGYVQSLVQCSNMLPTPYGGVTRRPPLVNIGSLSSTTVNSVVFYPSDARAFDFIYSSEYRYIVIFVVYTDPGGVESDFTRIVVQDTSGTQKAAIDVPYTQAELLELDIHQSNDTMWIAHNNHYPNILKRIADDDWRVEAYELNGGPFLDENESGLRKVGTSATKWSAGVQYLDGDNVIPSDTDSDDVTWIGTTKSHALSQYSAEYDFSSEGWVYQATYIARPQNASTLKTFRFIYYPYLLVRVNNATPPSSAVVGANVSINVVFTENAYDTGFEIEGTVAAVFDTGTEYYLKINCGSRYDAQYRIFRNSSTSDWIPSVDYFTTVNLPDVEIPATATPTNLTIYDQSSQYQYATWTYNMLTEQSKRAYFLIYGNDEGGAEITGSDNIYIGDSAFYYSANMDNIDRKPNGSITAFADAGGGQVTVTSAGHTIENGDSVVITGTTNYNGTFTAANVTTDNFEITDTWVADDATGSWQNSTVWTSDDIDNITGSNIANINTYGFEGFTDDDVGRLVRIRYGQGDQATGSFTSTADDSTGVSETYTGLGLVVLTANLNYSGRLVLEAQDDSGTDLWNVVGSIRGSSKDAEASVVYSSESLNTKLRVRMDEFTVGSSPCKWSLDIPDGAFVIYKIESVVSANSAVGRVQYGVNTFTNPEEIRYSFGAFGGAYGYPACVNIHENRLWFSGSIGEPFKHWGSVVNKYWNFAIGTFVTSALILQARADASTRITWTEVKENDLFFGTDFGEYSAANIQPTEVLSAENPPKTRRHTAFGSARIPAQLVGNDLAYISADKKKCRFLTYDGLTSDGYVSVDATHRVPDIAGSGFIGHVVQRTPFPVLWLWTADGTAVSLTLDKQHNVIGWAEHSTTDGLIKSLCVIPDANGIDEVYAVVYRDSVLMNASGTCSPDVTGFITQQRTSNIPDEITVSGTNPDYDGSYALEDGPQEQGLSAWANASSLNRIYAKPTHWTMRFPNAGEWRSATPRNIIPPRYGWYSVSGTTTPPTLAYDYLYTIAGGLYYLDISELGYVISRVSDDQPLFESATLEGEYTPVSGSGATGSVNIGALNYHIEKLDYTETEYTDNLNGPSEKTITSIMEPTPLSRGPNFLEGNMKFRSARGFVYVVKSKGGEVSVDGGATWTSLDYSDLTADSNGLYTGMIEFKVNSGFVDYSTVQFRTTGTDALTITGLSLEVEDHNRNGGR